MEVGDFEGAYEYLFILIDLGEGRARNVVEVEFFDPSYHCDYLGL